MTRTLHQFALTASGMAMAIACVAVAATTDPSKAPKGAALAIFLGAAVVPAACIIGAARID
jgi:hypothetical protein